MRLERKKRRRKKKSTLAYHSDVPVDLSEDDLLVVLEVGQEVKDELQGADQGLVTVQNPVDQATHHLLLRQR